MTLHSSVGMMRGTRSSGNRRSSPESWNVMPWSRNARPRVAQRPAKSAGDSVCSASCSASAWRRGCSGAANSCRMPPPARIPRADPPSPGTVRTACFGVVTGPVPTVARLGAAACSGAPAPPGLVPHGFGLVRARVVVVESERRADLGRRYPQDVAVADADESVPLPDGTRVPEPRRQLRLDERAGAVVPDDLGPAVHQEPRLLLLVVDLERQPLPGRDVQDLADVGPVLRRPVDLPAPRLLDAAGGPVDVEGARRRDRDVAHAAQLRARWSLRAVMAGIGPGSTSFSS